MPTKHSLYQQYHAYSVGSQNRGDDWPQRTKWSKDKIAPVESEFLANIEAYLCVRGNDELAQRIQDGLDGKLSRRGILFIGSNNFGVESFQLMKELQPARWIIPFPKTDRKGLRPMILTVTIDRKDSGKTQKGLYAFTNEPSTEIPETSWVDVGY
jgi:hypothetical protein